MPGSASASSHTNLETFFFFFFIFFLFFFIFFFFYYFILLLFILFFIYFIYYILFYFNIYLLNECGASEFRTPNLPIMWPPLCPLRHGGTPDTRRLTSEGSDKERRQFDETSTGLIK